MRNESRKLVFTIIIYFTLFSLVSIALLGTQATKLNTSQTSINATLTPHEPILIYNDANFSDYSLPGSGTALNPYIIENYNITTLNNAGIIVRNTTDYFVIRNCYVDASFAAIGVTIVEPGTGEISGVTCKHNDFWGIVIGQSSQITVKNSVSEDNSEVFGIGIYLLDSFDITLSNNTCTNNNYGVYLENTNSSVISYNTFADNLEYGVVLEDNTNENIVHHNKFIDNGGVMQARDDGVNNLFYEASSEQGNYWDNWSSKDSIVPIGGTANNEDPYPLDENLIRLASLFFLPVLIALVIVVYKKRIKNEN
ncbi:MAG: right-handed parallel beta-helix repeat-containing protein [Candidatus Heimdallarchaeaceae archaeon]